MTEKVEKPFDRDKITQQSKKRVYKEWPKVQMLGGILYPPLLT